MIREEAITKYVVPAIEKTWNDKRCKEILEALEQEPILDKIKGYINYIRNTGMGKEKSLEFIEKFIEGLKAESEDKV